MPIILSAPPMVLPTAADLNRKFGAMPMNRFRLDRFPADESDVEELHDTEKRLYELVDGYLVEKDMAFEESAIGMVIGRHMGNFTAGKKLGIVAGADGMMKLAPGLVRIPDVSFVGRSQFPTGKIPQDAIPSIHPDLAVEVLSPSNTEEEMDAKLDDYFTSGTKLVWIVDPPSKSVVVYDSDDRSVAKTLAIADTLDGGTVLPGFNLPVAAIFEELDLN